MSSEIKPNSLQAWLLATRPKTLTGAAIPIILAGALAWHDGCFDGWTWLCCLFFAGGMQVVANLINDLYDYLRGTDREDRLGPERACAQGWITPKAMRKGIVLSIFISCLFGLGALALTWQQLPYHGIELVVLGLSCVGFAFLYTSVFSYLGLGDLLVLVFFGFVPVCGTYFLMSLQLTSEIWVLGFISGIAIDALLIINNYRDRDQDKISGKRTLIVLFGEPFGRYLYLSVGLLATLLACLLLYHIGNAGKMVALIVYLGLHLRTWLKMVEIRKGKALNLILGETSRNMLMLSLLLGWALL